MPGPRVDLPRAGRRERSNRAAEIRVTPEDDLPTTDGRPGGGALSVPETALAVEGYRIRERIGHGGMGEVYAAEQTRPVRRRVALKVIKPGMDSREIVARFESERQALAMMDHGAIAKVLDAGTTALGRPFFVMEYVNGIPITQHCDRQRLSNRERLALFVKVCEGVQHAHQKAIIHRDLKPSNVLISIQDGKAQPKIIDFGVAKALGQRLTDATMYTQLGQVIGTLEYMSPEQAEMSAQDIDTRSDVYSLGVMLYELLVGELPFETAGLRRLGFDEIRRRIREEEPPRPSTRVGVRRESSIVAGERRRTDPGTLVRQLRGDLDWITMKALEKDRTRRYGSVGELAADIQRYLDDQPVLARPPSLGYRLGKLIRRHRAAVAAVATAAAALLVGLVLATAGLVRASHERDRKEAALAEAETITTFLSDMLGAADPGSIGREATVRQVLDAASSQIGGGFTDRPQVEARLRRTIGNTYVSLGRLDEADEHLARALDLRRRVLGGVHPLVLESMVDLGELRYAQGRLDDAERLFQAVFDARSGGLGDRHPGTEKARLHLGNVRFQQGRYAAAADLHRAALDGLRESLGDEHPDTLLAMFNLASDYWALGRLDEAEPLYRSVLEGRTRTLSAEHPATLDALNNLAALYHVERRFTDAENLYRRALEVGRRVRGEDHPETLVTLSNLGELLVDRGRSAEGEDVLSDAVDRKRLVLGGRHPSTLYTLAILARAYERSGRLDAARQACEEVLEGRLAALGAEHPQTIEAQSVLERLTAALSALGSGPRVASAKALAPAVSQPPGRTRSAGGG